MSELGKAPLEERQEWIKVRRMQKLDASRSRGRYKSRQEAQDESNTVIRRPTTRNTQIFQVILLPIVHSHLEKPNLAWATTAAPPPNNPDEQRGDLSALPFHSIFSEYLILRLSGLDVSRHWALINAAQVARPRKNSIHSPSSSSHYHHTRLFGTPPPPPPPPQPPSPPPPSSPHAPRLNYGSTSLRHSLLRSRYLAA